MRFTARAAFLALTTLAAACATDEARQGRDAYSSAPIDANRLSIITKTLASDEFEGRAPGTPGEAKTVAYLAEQFRQLGLEPAGDNGTFLQRVPLIRTQLQKGGSVSIRRGGERTALRVPDDVYLSTVRETDRARIDNAPLVLVGYGVTAPERQWDDFKGVDLTGKIAVFLVNDPDFEAAAGEPVAGTFGGQAMTYYGRWTYKFEEAARQGAAAAFIVHMTEPASYGWN
ncbi:MAG TPA: peptidase M20, partial [Allosphingosinicella sp.]